MITLKEALNLCDKERLEQAFNEEFSNEVDPSIFTKEALEFISLRNNLEINKDLNKILIAYDYYYYYDGIKKTKVETCLCDKEDVLRSNKVNVNDFSIEELYESRDCSIVGPNEIGECYICNEYYDYYTPNKLYSIYIPNCMINRYGLEKLVAIMISKQIKFVFVNTYKCDINDKDVYNQSNNVDICTIERTPFLEDVINDKVLAGIVNLKNLNKILLMCNDIIDEVKEEEKIVKA